MYRRDETVTFRAERAWMVLTGAVLAGAALTGLSCGGGGNNYAGFASAYCEVFQPCCAAAHLLANGNLCRALLTAFPAPAYNKATGDACVSDLRTASAQPDFCMTGDSQIKSCQALLGHNLDQVPGGICMMTADCAPSSEGTVTCTFANDDRGGLKCQVQIRGRAGDTPCVGTTGRIRGFEPFNLNPAPDRGFLCDVGDGLRCDGGTCVPLKAAGEECVPLGPQECLVTGYCDSVQLACAARKVAGDFCGHGYDECADGAACGPDRICFMRFANGATCQSSVDCLSSNCDGGICKETVNPGLALICGVP